MFGIRTIRLVPATTGAGVLLKVSKLAYITELRILQYSG